MITLSIHSFLPNLILTMAVLHALPLPTQAQSSVYYNPFAITDSSYPILRSSSSNVFDSDTGRLHIGRINAVGGVLDGEVVYNVVFSLTDDGNFKLEDFEQIVLDPDEECTVSEVLDAIPFLSLELSIDEAEQLIGCRANYSAGSVTLESGRRVSVGWQGANGVPNPAPGSTSDTWVPLSGLYPSAGVTPVPISLTTSRPRITMHYLDGEFESFSYFDGAETENCEEGGLLEGFMQLETGMTVQDVAETLGCSGNLRNTTISSQEAVTEYRWVAGDSGSYVPIGYNPFLPSNRDSETINASFIDGRLQTLSYSGSTSDSTVARCTPEEMDGAFQLLQEGDIESVTLDRIPCEAQSTSTGIADGSVTRRYSWETGVYQTTIFAAPNRALSVSVVDGVTDSFSLRRF
ncbi:MAG: hypothetical protein R3F41_05115 [Gammaproteobacteria bacterium]|nr:hypothetical protein [Pseudomonadales bacterium]MCP5345317.1 hypothetical protein [Pseudomonadales bacterium]